MIVIPFKDFPSFKEELTLDNIPYVLKFDWVSRGAFWLLSVYDREQNAILEGKKLVLNYEMFSQFTDRRLPPGRLYVVDSTYTNFEPLAQFDFLNERAYITYVDEAEVETI